MLEIRKIDEINQDCVEVIRDSFTTVANDFNLTKDNAPTNAAFVEMDALLAMQQKGAEMYGGFCEGQLIGFVAIKKSNDQVYYMEKLAVTPGSRHKGYGRQLMDFAARVVKEVGGKKISIGIINENTVLKDWYINNGFHVTHIKRFPHLPFNVCFLIREV